MRIYVDELPECCNDCELGYFYDCQYCSLSPDLAREDIWVEKEKYCPLQSLADYTKQVRKEVCEEIRTFAYDTFKEFGCFDETDLEHILDQIQGGEKTKNAETK